MKMQLKNKVAIVTGASAGIGAATAKRFAAEGASVVLVARRRDALQAVEASIASAGGKATVVVGDVADESTAQQAVEAALKSYGRLDIAFNNAGVLGAMGPTTEIDVEAWNQTLRINLTSAFLSAKHQIPAIVKTAGGGSVLFTSTFVGHTVGFPGVAAYATSKSGLIGLTQALAAEWGPKGVRVNALLPGAVETDMFTSMNGTPESQAFIAGLHALKRVAKPEEIAATALYLASDASSFVSGAALLADGGLSINRT
jgi:NAD(P)-dependent dehydrogenase (short-subunit alcohol dehydrogenase family)